MSLHEVARGRFEGPSFPTYECAFPGCPLRVRAWGKRWEHTTNLRKINAAHRAGTPWAMYPNPIPVHKAEAKPE